ncbi:MAG: ATP-binding cassette domain-containing protein, partial [Oscillospiraceae bacterium]|nr:ATP-binding cassette domain-containing protein [Oscillospiraceae bacterium]
MPILETVDLIKQYKQSEEVITAVDRVNLKVEDGEFIAIIGTSGSGKSTLLHVCAGLDRPNSGKVIVRGQDIVKMKADELSRYR